MRRRTTISTLFPLIVVVLVGIIISDHPHTFATAASSLCGSGLNLVKNDNQRRQCVKQKSTSTASSSTVNLSKRTTTTTAFVADCGSSTSKCFHRHSTTSLRLLSRDNERRPQIQQQKKCSSLEYYSSSSSRQTTAIRVQSFDNADNNEGAFVEKTRQRQQSSSRKNHESSSGIISSRRDHLIRAAKVTCSSVAFSLESFVSVASSADSSTSSNRVNVYPGGNNIKSVRSIGGLPKKIRSICVIMDELQRDLMQERWDLVELYPNQLRSYVPIFTQYTDAAFGGDEPAYKGLRVALRYEVGRFFAGVERLKQATSRKDLQSAFLAYAEMALHFDRYLNVGNLYTYQDDTVSYETFYDGIDNSQLVYEDPKKKGGLAEVRDLILLIEGPDKGKTGIVIGVYPSSVNNNCVVKLDRYKSSSGIREIRVVPRLWAAKRLGEQDPDDVFLIPRPGEPPYNSQQQSSATNDNNNNNPFKLVGGGGSNKSK